MSIKPNTNLKFSIAQFLVKTRALSHEGARTKCNFDEHALALHAQLDTALCYLEDATVLLGISSDVLRYYTVGAHLRLFGPARQTLVEYFGDGPMCPECKFNGLTFYHFRAERRDIN